MPHNLLAASRRNRSPALLVGRALHAETPRPGTAKARKFAARKPGGGTPLQDTPAPTAATPGGTPGGTPMQ
jgi:hypothetical protein